MREERERQPDPRRPRQQRAEDLLLRTEMEQAIAEMDEELRSLEEAERMVAVSRERLRKLTVYMSCLAKREIEDVNGKRWPIAEYLTAQGDHDEPSQGSTMVLSDDDDRKSKLGHRRSQVPYVEVKLDEGELEEVTGETKTEENPRPSQLLKHSNKERGKRVREEDTPRRGDDGTYSWRVL